MIDSSLEKLGLTLTGDALPKEHRTVKTFQKLISAMRSAESQLIAESRRSESELNRALKTNLELQEKCHCLELALKRYQLSERLNSLEKLTTADRQSLLEVTVQAA